MQIDVLFAHLFLCPKWKAPQAHPLDSVDCWCRRQINDCCKASVTYCCPNIFTTHSLIFSNHFYWKNSFNVSFGQKKLSSSQSSLPKHSQLVSVKVVEEPTNMQLFSVELANLIWWPVLQVLWGNLPNVAFYCHSSAQFSSPIEFSWLIVQKFVDRPPWKGAHRWSKGCEEIYNNVDGIFFTKDAW